MRAQTLSEARWIIAIFALLAVASWFFSVWLSVFFLLLLFCTVAFFRDPDRLAPADPNLIVAAADGTVSEIVEVDENEILKAKTRRVGIFLSIVDRQLTGAIARRIVAWAKIGDELKKGERFGMIRFGSRTELYLPLNAEVFVKVGDHVRGGSTIIARLPNDVTVRETEYLASAKSASPLREGERIEVRGFAVHNHNPNPTLSLKKKGEAKKQGPQAEAATFACRQ